MNFETFFLSQNDWVPNNLHVPVVVYRDVLPSSEAERAAAEFECQFEANGWPAQWRDGVYDYHHYHSTAHEVLGVYSGSAELILGGMNGRVCSLAAGDAVLLPAGTGHCRKGLSADFRVVGAYPRGQSFDIRRQAATPEQRRKIEALGMPPSDPITGRKSFPVP